MRSLSPVLTIDRGAICENWRRLNALSGGKAGAVVKANGYGLGVGLVAKALWAEGAREFFVATIDEAKELAELLPQARIYELSGFSVYSERSGNIVPVIASIEQARALNELNSREYALQFDSGMTRIGININELPEIAHLKPALIMSHLACADEPSHPKNKAQLHSFQMLKDAFPDARASLGATGGILLGEAYHFDLTRPGIGIYGGAPFIDAKPVIQIELPVIQCREIDAGAEIGYGAMFQAKQGMRVATLLGGYADGISRALSGKGACLFADDIPCPILGRISMDTLTVDITRLDHQPERLQLIHPSQTINDLAHMAGTIAYELFTSLGSRYKREVI